MSTVRPNLQSFAFFGYGYRDCVASTGFAVIESNEESDPRFIYQNLFSTYVMKQIDSLVVGSNYPAINSSDVRKLWIPVPEKKEQQKIAKILTTVDNLIEKTEALIEKYQAIKQGMMHDLFTRGIDTSGQLRPSHHDAPHLYKQTELGWIPKDWGVCSIGNYISFLKSGLSRRIVEEDIGIPVLISGNIQGNQFDSSELKYWYRTDPQGANMESYILDDKDILLCFINSIEQIGKVCIYDDIGRKCIYTTNLFRIKSSSLTDQVFLYQLLCTEFVQGEIRNITKPAINQASFTTGDFKKIPVPLIEKGEQQTMVKQLGQLQSKLAKDKEYFDKLQTIKKGLMQDLLTGNVRVPV